MQAVRKFLGPASAASALALHQTLHSGSSEQDAAYLAALPAPPSHAEPHIIAHIEKATHANIDSAPVRKVRDAARAVDIAGTNLAVLASTRALNSTGEINGLASTAAPIVSGLEAMPVGGDTGTSLTAPDSLPSAIAQDAAYLQSLERQMIKQLPGVKFAPSTYALEIKTGADASTVHREVAFVAIVRGCHPSIVDAVVRSLQAAAAADTLGLRYYLVTDATPEDVVDHLERALHAEIPDPYVSPVGVTQESTTASSTGAGAGWYGLETREDGAVPILAVFDRAAATQRKYIMPPSLHTPELDSSPQVEGEGEGLPPVVQLLLASIPYPSEIAEYTQAFAHGEMRPTLLGMPRPPNDAYPGHGPYLTQVVSESWDDIVLDSRRDVLLEAYLTHCPMCLCLAPRLRMLGYILHHFGPRVSSLPNTSSKALGDGATGHAAVRVAVMNVDDNERPVDWMPGPAFPTIQLFCKGSSSGSSVTGPWSKAHGPSCTHTHLASAETFENVGKGSGAAFSAPPHSHLRLGAGGPADAKSGARQAAAAAAVRQSYKQGLGITAPAAGPGSAVQPKEDHPAVARLASKGTPPCIPSLDFTHPSQPGKSALPTVQDLVHWVAAHCSEPFDPAAIRVPAAEVRHSRDRMIELGLLPPPSAAPSPAAASPSSTASAFVPLMDLVNDMDAECRVYETAVFDSFYYEAMLGAYAKACFGDTRGSTDSHNGGESDDLPVTLRGPLSTYANPSSRAVLPLAQALLSRLRAVGVEGAVYGRLDDTVAALDALGAYVEEKGMRDGARAWLVDQEQAKVTVEAVKAAARLVAEEKRGRYMQ